jgi:hypothetical protein
MTRTLLEPIIDDGIRSTHFFEGRLLTGRDLKDEQLANRKYRDRLGRCIGSGIVTGLGIEVDSLGGGTDTPVVKVGKGLAINALGQTLEITNESISIALSRDLSDPEIEADVFADCGDPRGTEVLPNGAGLYILTISPGSDFEGFAEKSGLLEEGVARGCGRRYVVEGVRFRLIEVDSQMLANLDTGTADAVDQLLLSPTPAGPDDPASISRLRNLAAHLCFGTPDRLARSTEPFDAAPVTTALTEIAGVENGLHECDVPLGLIYWTFDGIGFVDEWSVKRQADFDSGTAIDGTPDTRERDAVTDAMLRQFQAQVWDLVNGTDPRFERPTVSALTASAAHAFFHFLPPVGLLPTAVGGSRGFDPNFFFALQPHRHQPPDFDAEFIDAQQATAIWQFARHYEAIRSDSREMLWVYKVWQHDRDSEAGEPVTPFVMFTSGHMPPQSIARFDRARWDYSHYMKCC